MRREVCMGLYRFCFGKTVDGKIGYILLLLILVSLFSFFEDVLFIKLVKNFEVSKLINEIFFSDNWNVILFLNFINKVVCYF